MKKSCVQIPYLHGISQLHTTSHFLTNSFEKLFSELNIEDPEHDTSHKIAKSQLLRQFRQRSENPSPAERVREDPIENSHMSKVQV